MTAHKKIDIAPRNLDQERISREKARDSHLSTSSAYRLLENIKSHFLFDWIDNDLVRVNAEESDGRVRIKLSKFYGHFSKVEINAGITITSKQSDFDGGWLIQGRLLITSIVARKGANAPNDPEGESYGNIELGGYVAQFMSHNISFATTTPVKTYK